MPNEILDALRVHNWYPAAALLLTLLTQIVRENRLPALTDGLNKLWYKIPDGWRWLVPSLSGAITGFTAAFAAHVSFSMALAAALGGFFGIGLPAMGGHALLKESPAHIDGGAGGKPVNP